MIKSCVLSFVALLACGRPASAQADTTDILVAVCATSVIGQRQWYAPANEVAWVRRVALAFGEGTVAEATARPYCTERHERLVRIRLELLSPDSGMVYVESSCQDRASPQAPPSTLEVHGFSVRRSLSGWRALLAVRVTA